MCNNGEGKETTITPMHETMERLYIAAKKLRDIAGQTELATLLGTSPQTVNNWESRGISFEGMILAEKYVGCRASWIMDGTGEMSTRTDGLREQDSGIKLKKVPLISWVRAGSMEEAFDVYAPGVAEEWILTPDKVGSSAFALRVRGDSMEPEFVDGDIIIIDPTKSAFSGSFVVVRTVDSNEATFKQLVIDAGRQFLKPLNPRYPLIEITKNAVICGVVVYKTKSYS